MTIEEAKEILNRVEIAKPIKFEDYADMREALNMAIKALEQTELNPSYNSVKTELEQTMWIPVSERLPEEYMFCLISVKIEPLDCEISYEVDKARFYRNQFISQSIESVGVIAKKSVIAWMPLPEPYKEGTEDDK